ncbi:MAG: hypothetical protein KDA44_05235 [Planctomycetales bacterium]|nr:hypothetical protein [Planctomycetales bacterium]
MSSRASVSPRLQLALLATLAGTAVWACAWRYGERRTAFRETQASLQRCTGLAAQIRILRDRPDQAASESRSEQALAEAIERAVKEAGVGIQQIARIEPQPPRRVGETDYLEHATAVQLDGVTLAQLATWLTRLKQGDLQQLRVSSARIVAPFQTTESAGPETWNVEVTLTYLVYLPKNPAPNST